MWELCISIDKENNKMITPLFHRLSGLMKPLRGVVVYGENESRAKISLACEEQDSIHLSPQINEEIINIFLDEFKKDYLIKNAKLPLNNPINYNAFIKALVAFDREFDRELVQKKFSLDDEVMLDGIYNFRLKDLKQRWQEVCNLANDNAFYLNYNDTFIELMRFLVNTIESKTDEALIESKGELFVVTNMENNEQSIVQLEELLPTLIYLAPLKIFVGKDTVIPENVDTLIRQIFSKAAGSATLV